MAKQPATIFVCQSCGSQSRKWLGQCPDCSEWNTMVEEKFRAQAQSRSYSGSGFSAKPVAFDSIEPQDEARTSSGIEEFDRTLGGGRCRSLVLIGARASANRPSFADRRTTCPNRQKVLYVSRRIGTADKDNGERLGVSAEGLLSCRNKS